MDSVRKSRITANETVEKVHFGMNLQIFKKVLFLDPSKEVKHSRFRASTAICLHAFYHQPRKILFRQAQRVQKNFRV
jgi:hypothetical protein